MAGRPRSKATAAALGISTREYAAASRAGKTGRLIASMPRVPIAAAEPRKAVVPVDVVDAQFGAALAEAASAGSDMNSVFEELRKESMLFALEVMRMKLDPDERSFNKLLSVKQQITTAVLTATTRVRPGDLRERDDDGLGALLKELKAGPTAVTEADLLD